MDDTSTTFDPKTGTTDKQTTESPRAKPVKRTKPTYRPEYYVSGIGIRVQVAGKWYGTGELIDKPIREGKRDLWLERGQIEPIKEYK